MEKPFETTSRLTTDLIETESLEKNCITIKYQIQLLGTQIRNWKKMGFIGNVYRKSTVNILIREKFHL